MTRICASLSSRSDCERASSADMVEIRTDLFDTIPEMSGTDMLVTFRDKVDLSILPEGYSGMIDVGTNPKPDTKLKVITSHHNYKWTPSFNETASILNDMDGDIVKGAFAVRDFNDLHDLMTASKMVEKPHILIGMNEMGMLTRVRSSLLGNEFTFGFVGEPTAPGQLSLEKMKELGDGCMVTGIVGNPLAKTKSPQMHAAAYKAAGVNGIYLKFETRGTNNIANVIREYEIRGVNVTIPYKESIITQLDAVDSVAGRIGAVNTIVNDDGKLTGYNTDIIGIGIAAERTGFHAKGKKAVMIGYGGAARACVSYLAGKGCDVVVTGRDLKAAEDLANHFGCSSAESAAINVSDFDLVVNSTPIGMYESDEYPIDITRLTAKHTVFDMVYGAETKLLRAASSAGASVMSGEDMLAGQGAASFELWTSKGNMFETMRKEL